MKRVAFLSVFGLLAAAASSAGEPLRFAVEQDQVLVTYQASLGRQQLSGVSRALTGAAEEVGGGLHVSAKVSIESFQSGSVAVDALLARAADAAHFPMVELDAQAPLAKKNGQFTVRLEGTLTLHGVARPVSVPLTVLRDGKTLFVKAAFPVDLESYGLSAAAIGSTAVNPRVQIELHALLKPAEARLADRG